MCAVFWIMCMIKSKVIFFVINKITIMLWKKNNFHLILALPTALVNSLSYTHKYRLKNQRPSIWADYLCWSDFFGGPLKAGEHRQLVWKRDKCPQEQELMWAYRHVNPRNAQACLQDCSSTYCRYIHTNMFQHSSFFWCPAASTLFYQCLRIALNALETQGWLFKQSQVFIFLSEVVIF